MFIDLRQYIFDGVCIVIFLKSFFLLINVCCVYLQFPVMQYVLVEYYLSLPRKHAPIHLKIRSDSFPSLSRGCNLSGLVYTMPVEFENGGFTLKTHQMFSVHTTPEEFKNAAITGHLGFWLRETRAGKYHDYRS